MLRIRGFMPQDVPAVTALMKKVFGRPNWNTPEQIASYLESALLSGPWYDETRSSLVCLGDDGRITGFLGVMARPMILGGRRLQAAVSTKFMVDEQPGRAQAAVSLLKAFLSRPYDLAFADVATEEMRRLWEAVGGTTVLLYSMHWRRRLRPFRWAASWLRKQRGYGPFALALSPFCIPADALFARLPVNRFHDPPDGSTTSELDPATFLDHYAELAGPNALRLEFDAPSLRWTWEIAAATRPGSTLHKRIVRSAGGEVLGWYICFFEPGADAEVIHILSRKASTSEVLRHLYADAWRSGAGAAFGRAHPPQMNDLSVEHAALGAGPPWVLVHSNQPDVLEAFHRGSACLSRLEGEW